MLFLNPLAEIKINNNNNKNKWNVFIIFLKSNINFENSQSSKMEDKKEDEQ